MPRSALRASLVGACLLASASTAHALDLPAALGQIDGATSATLYLVPPMAIFGTSLDEARMQAASCRYATSDRTAIAALTRLIAAGGVTGSAVYQRPDMREGVYLTLADGAVLKIFLQDNNGGGLPVGGIAEQANGGNLQRVAITASKTLSADLRRWATGRTDGTGSACDRMVPKPLEPLPPIPRP